MKYRNFFYKSRWLWCHEHKEKETMNTRFEWLDFLMHSITIWNLSLKKNYFSMMKYRNFVFLQFQVAAMSRAQRKRNDEHKIWMTTLPHAQYHNLEPFSKKETILVWWNIVIFFTSSGDCGVTSTKKKKRWTQDLND